MTGESNQEFQVIRLATISGISGRFNRVYAVVAKVSIVFEIEVSVEDVLSRTDASLPIS